MVISGLRRIALGYPRATRVVKVVTASALSAVAGGVAAEIAEIGSQLLPALGAVLGAGASAALLSIRSPQRATEMPLIARAISARVVAPSLPEEVERARIEMLVAAHCVEQQIVDLACRALQKHAELHARYLGEEPSIPFQLGTTLQDRVPKDRLGQGGQADTRMLWNRFLHRIEVEKVFRAADEEQLRRIKIEGRALARFHNPHVPEVYAFEIGDGRSMALIMEYIAGAPLDQVLKRTGGKIPLPLALKLFTDLISAFQLIHEQGIIHRDVKPENIFIAAVSAPGEQEKTLATRVIDFGIAKTVEETAQQLTVEGTPQYIAPEVWVNQKPTPMSDIYGLGVLFFEMLAGVPPFSAEGVSPTNQIRTVDFALGVLRNPPPSLLGFIPDLPRVSEPLARLIDSMLGKDPLKRPSAGEILNALRVLDYYLRKKRPLAIT